MVPANGVDLCVETFGEPSDPPVLLIAGGASSMDFWDDEFCRRLAAGGRYVIRYDHRDTGRSTSFPAGRPPYSGKDLADDAVGLLDALGERSAHLVGLSLGGGLAQRIAVEHPAVPLTLTLMSTTSAATSGSDSPPSSSPSSPPSTSSPGAGDPQPPEVDWADRRAAVEALMSEAREYGGPFTADGPPLRRLAERVADRTTDLAASHANHWLAAPGPPITTLATISVPTLVMHGTADPLFPMSSAEDLVRQIPGARLVKLEGVGHEHPPAAVWQQVIGEILKHTA